MPVSAVLPETSWQHTSLGVMHKRVCSLQVPGGAGPAVAEQQRARANERNLLVPWRRCK